MNNIKNSKLKNIYKILCIKLYLKYSNELIIVKTVRPLFFKNNYWFLYKSMKFLLSKEIIDNFFVLL